MEKTYDLKIKLQKKPNCVIELDIEAPPKLVNDAKKEALKELKKEIEVPGFRKGKAPDELILSKYEKSLKNAWEKKIADLGFINANIQEKLPPLGISTKISFNLKEYSLDKGATISYSYETEPEVPDIDIKDIKLKKIKKHLVTDEEVEEAVRQIRFFHAKWSEVQRPIEENDYIIIDLDSQEPPAKVFNDTRFEVSDKGMSKWMKDLVIGANVNDKLEGISKPDDTLTDEEKKNFEPKKVLVTIKKIETASLPDVNEEFAKKVGALSVEQMYSSIRHMLENQAESSHSEQNRKQVKEYLLNNYKFDLPLSLLEKETIHRRESILADEKFQKKLENFSDKEKKAFEETIKKHAEESIRIFFISKKIVTDFKINISEEEIKEFALNILYKELGQKMDPQNIPKDIFALALSRLVLFKAEDYILDQTSKI